MKRAAATEKRTAIPKASMPSCALLAAMLVSGLVFPLNSLAVPEQDDEASAQRSSFYEQLQIALGAHDIAGRKSALQSAQAYLDHVFRLEAAHSQRSVREIMRLSDIRERSVSRALESSTRSVTYNSLMWAVWQSPYQSDGTLGVNQLQHIQQALDLLSQVHELDAEHSEKIEAVQRVYWASLHEHRNRNQAEFLAITQEPDAVVFDIKAHRQANGGVDFYQLVGETGFTIRWKPASTPGFPAGFEKFNAVRVCDEKPELPWVIVNGIDMTQLLSEQPEWIQAISEQANVIVNGALINAVDTSPYNLAARDDMANSGIIGMQPEQTTEPDDAKPGKICLADIDSQLTLGCWPIESMQSPGFEPLKSLILQALHLWPRTPPPRE